MRCPGCGMPMHLPTADEGVVPLFTENTKMGESGNYDAVVRRDTMQLEWELQGNKVAQSAQGAGRTPWGSILFMGVLISGVVGAMVMFLMKGGEAEHEKPPAIASKPALVEKKAEREVRAESVQNELALDAGKMADLAKRFTKATKPDELLPILRASEDLPAKLKAFYPNGKIQNDAFKLLESTNRAIGKPWLIQLTYISANRQTNTLAVVELANGDLKIDWEATLGYNPSWEKIQQERQTKPVNLRVISHLAHYYNTGFDDENWQAFELSNPRQDVVFMGYAKRDSEAASKLRPAIIGGTNSSFIVTVRYPENPQSANQVIIDEVVTDGWVMPLESDPSSSK